MAERFEKNQMFNTFAVSAENTLQTKFQQADEAVRKYYDFVNTGAAGLDTARSVKVVDKIGDIMDDYRKGLRQGSGQAAVMHDTVDKLHNVAMEYGLDTDKPHGMFTNRQSIDFVINSFAVKNREPAENLYAPRSQTAAPGPVSH